MGEVSISCPECGKGMAVNRGGGLLRDDCGLKVWRRVAGETLSDGELSSGREKRGPRLRGAQVP